MHQVSRVMACRLVHWTPSHWAQVRCPGQKFVSLFFLLHLCQHRTLFSICSSYSLYCYNLPAKTQCCLTKTSYICLCCSKPTCTKSLPNNACSSEEQFITTVHRKTMTVLGIWNLDFFRTVIPDICLNVNTPQVLALDYLVAFYPMLLTREFQQYRLTGAGI